MNIIADVAGRFDELMLLVQKMPKEEFLFVGDLNDRGTQTPQVIDWVMKNAKCVKSNHGDMLVAYYNYHMKTEYKCGTYTIGGLENPRNGLKQTIDSYGGVNNIPKEHIEWLANLPWYYKNDKIFVSHAPVFFNLDFNNSKLIDFNSNYNLLWNRNPPGRKELFQIFGHNTYYKEYVDELGPYAICIDNCGNNKLTGLNYSSMVIYEQEYLK